jgi:hemin uptake protein HemP
MRHVTPPQTASARSNLRHEKLSLPGMRKAAAPAEQNGLLESASLFKGTREIRIRHNDETYRLTITKLGKLILTK